MKSRTFECGVDTSEDSERFGLSCTFFRKLSYAAVTLCFVICALCSCSVRKMKTQTSDRFMFGTVCSITVYNSPFSAGKTKNILDNVWSEMRNLELRISSKDENGDVYKYNHGKLDTLNSDAELLLNVAFEFMRYTDGSFSPYTEAISEAWGIGTEGVRVPSQDEIDSALKEKKLDFGALGKGYASDVAREKLKEAGISSAIINFGGNICTLGGKPTGYKDKKSDSYEIADFVIGIQDPDLSRGGFKEKVEVRDACVVSSGDYERFFISDGVRYHHIFDAKTGYPVRNGLRQVTVIGPSGLVCDVLSTSLFIEGEKKGNEILKYFPDYRAIFTKSVE